jgi:hypothetical protein
MPERCIQPQKDLSAELNKQEKPDKPKKPWKPNKLNNPDDLNVPNGYNGQLVSPFLIVYNVTGVETYGFQTCDIARVKEIPGKLPG